ncbi:TetR/AcrR family transcriptional regulator [Chitinophaga oryzae]|nr:TetR/AcrR family transcriptional regulator [Chitinophaga oryzae]
MQRKHSDMGIAERKERERADMRRRIVDAAIKMFVEEGYEKVSIRNIADRIEYSPATIYLYYKDKDELLYDVQKEAFLTLADHFARNLTAADPLERLEQLAWAYVGFYRENPELYDLMFIIKAPMNAEHEKEKWENGDRAYDALYNLVAECVKAKKIRFTDATVAAMSIWAFAHGLIALDLRSRLKVCKLHDNELNIGMDDSIKAYLEVIKR